MTGATNVPGRNTTDPATKFNASGWRGLAARDFTFNNVRLATRGIAQYLKTELANPWSPIHERKPVVILGHDTCEELLTA